MYPTTICRQMIGIRIDMGSLLRANTYGKRQRLLREDAQLTQIELTELVNKAGVKVTQGYLSKLEKSTRMPSAALVAGVAKALNANPAFLLMLSDDPTPHSDSDIDDIEPYSDEVTAACEMLEMMDEDTRRLMLDNIKVVFNWDQERRGLHEQIYRMMLKELSSGAPDTALASVMNRLRDLHGHRLLPGRDS